MRDAMDSPGCFLEAVHQIWIRAFHLSWLTLSGTQLKFSGVVYGCQRT